MERDTILVHSGRDPHRNHGVVNPPVFHASTVLSRTVAEMEEKRGNRYAGVVYGLHGTPTTFALEDAVAALEGGYRGIAYPSGLAAIVAPMLALTTAGDHVLVVDSVYGPTRRLCDTLLRSFGVETTYYDPHVGAGIAALIRDNTRVVFVESPGSVTFEVQDIPAIAAAAHARGAKVLMDNTWATPLFFRAMDHGVDVSIHAATKYIGGHSDLMMGVVVTTEETFLPVRTMTSTLGYHAAPDDCYLALRGLRSMGVRLERHQRNALAVAAWLRERPEVEAVLYPALPGAPGHALWKRDFAGASGLFSIVLKPVPRAAAAAMIDGLRYFGIGSSWGGFESLIQPGDGKMERSATRWPHAGPVVRIHVGLEDPADLIADLEAGFARLNAAAREAQ